MVAYALKNPPIKEAILTVSFSNVLAFDKLSDFYNSEFIQNNYPVKTNVISIKMDVSGTKRLIDGFLLKPKDANNRSIQIKVGQLSFHNTNGYMGWDNFFAEFKNIWSHVCHTLGENDLQQVSVRYINQLVFDYSANTPISDYLLITPTLPTELNILKSFFIQLNIPNPEKTLSSVVTETFNIIPVNFMQVVLDINVTKNKILKCNSEMMWDSFTEIRDFKNKIFFNSLTEKTLSKYD